MRRLRILFGLLAIGMHSASPARAGSWIPKGPPGTPIESLAVDPLDPDILYATLFPPRRLNGPSRSLNLVFKSTDGARHWLSANVGLPIFETFGFGGFQLTIDPNNPRTIYSTWADTSAAGISLFRSDDAAATWISNPPVGLGPTVVRQQAVFLDPVSRTVEFLVAVDADGALWVLNYAKSFDWSKVQDGVISVAIDPKTATAYAATSHGQLLESTDGGESWSQVSGLFSADYYGGLRAVAFDPDRPSRVYVGTGCFGAFRSMDGGATWEEIQFGQPDFTSSSATVRVLVIDPVETNTLYAEVTVGQNPFLCGYGPDEFGPHLFKSTDGGNNWRRVENGIDFGSAFTQDLPFGSDLTHFLIGCRRRTLPAQGGVCDPDAMPTLYAGTLSGVFKSVDRGENWSAVNEGLPSNHRIVQVAIACGDEGECKSAAAAPRTLYIASDEGLLKSVDDGDHWQPLNLGDRYVVAIDPKDPRTIYAITRVGEARRDGHNGLWKSSDEGATWRPADDGLPQSLDYLTALTIDPKDSAILYAATAAFDGLYQSSDGGGTWVPTGDGLPSIYDFVVNDLIIDPLSRGSVYAVLEGRYSGGSVVFMTQDGGGHWSRAADFDDFGGSPVTVRTLALDPKIPGTVYAATCFGLFKATDGGAHHWDLVGNGLPYLCVDTLLIVPRSPRTIYAVTETCDPSVFGCAPGMFRSSDGGVTFEYFTNFPQGSPVATLTIHPSALTRIYAGTVTHGLFAFAGCGDGYVDRGLGELCDDGEANGAPDSCCTADCAFKAAGTECRPARGVCDVEERCSGRGGDCPEDRKAPNFLCRPAMGECDVEERCDGRSDDCPADEVMPKGTRCGNAGDMCNGRDNQCPFNCGNGKIEPELGEQCDDGELNGTPDDGCRRDCKLKCGDGNLDPQEQCDTEPNCTGSCRLTCTKDADCKRPLPNRCTRLLCEKNGLCATGMGCPDDPCTGVNGGLNLLMCGFERHLGGDNCASPTNRKVADRVNGQLVRLLGKLRTVSALCGRAHAQNMIRSQLARVEGELGKLAVLAAQNTDQVCFDELNGIATENDGRLAFLQLQAHFLRKKLPKHLPAGIVPCELLNAGIEPSHIP